MRRRNHELAFFLLGRAGLRAARQERVARGEQEFGDPDLRAIFRQFRLPLLVEARTDPALLLVACDVGAISEALDQIDTGTLVPDDRPAAGDVEIPLVETDVVSFLGFVGVMNEVYAAADFQDEEHLL